jgi:hypothetical protein
MNTVKTSELDIYEVDASTLELSIAGFGLQLTGSALN